MQSTENVGSTKTYHSLVETLYEGSGYVKKIIKNRVVIRKNKN
jgi:hypothetical protein